MRVVLSGLFSAWLLVACDDTESRTIVISTHALSGCAVGLPDGSDAELSLRPVGDYLSEEWLTVPLAGTADALPIPEGTRGLEAELRLGSSQFSGYAERSDSEEVRILLWPTLRACRLSTGEYPAPGGGQGLGYDPVSRQVLLAGGDDPTQPSKSVEMLAFDAGTGVVTLGLSLEEEPRKFATVTPFAGRLLVAGGEDPLNSQDLVIASSRTAQVIAPLAATPVVGEVVLRVPRTRHAATVLPNGDTLLVGGRGPFGDALNLLEAVSPSRESAEVAGFPALQAPRFFPTVLGLDDGRLFIGGGTAADESPLSALEWLSLDARTRLGVDVPEELPARHDRAFVAMPGGGVLVVGGCAPRTPRPGEDCSMCRNGCPPRLDASADEYDAWWVLPDDTVKPLADFALPAPRPVLLGDHGRPLLSSGSSDSPLYRFDPWQARFFPTDDAIVPCPPRAGLPALSIDAEAFVWVTDVGECASAPALFGMRTGFGNRYSSGIELVPDRPPAGPEGERARYADGELWFAAGSDVRVYVAGRDYADFALSLEIAEDSDVPRLVFTSPERVGALVVALPSAARGRLTLVRSAATLSLGPDVLAVPRGRLRIGFAAGNAQTRLRAIDVARR